MLRLRLPVIYCPDCAGQLVTHFFWVEGTEPPVLVCIFCAPARRSASARLRAICPDGADPIAPPLEAAEATRLLLDIGAEVDGDYVDAASGDPVGIDEIRAALAHELEADGV